VSVRGRCAIGVMAKAPVAGRAKTRLTPPLAPEQAAALSAAFLRDTTENIRQAAGMAPIDGFVAYAPAGAGALFDGCLAPGTGLLLADGTPPMPAAVQGFGRCLLHAVRDLLEPGYGAACVVNSDSPTLPTALLAQAANALLQPGERVVLGPAEDGGYYLLGVTAPHAHLFADIAWSTGAVAAATRDRAREIGLPLVELAAWYDVDDAASLQRLIEEVEAPFPEGALTPYPAPASAACLQGLGLRWNSALAAAQ
jgi:rSAM/selenodomain-associated transferase 1